MASARRECMGGRERERGTKERAHTEGLFSWRILVFNIGVAWIVANLAPNFMFCGNMLYNTCLKSQSYATYSFELNRCRRFQPALNTWAVGHWIWSRRWIEFKFGTQAFGLILVQDLLTLGHKQLIEVIDVTTQVNSTIRRWSRPKLSEFWSTSLSWKVLAAQEKLKSLFLLNSRWHLI